MMRTDGDTWDIVSSVGRTALGVAAFRALDADSPDALARDEYAKWFVEAAGDPHFTGLLADPPPLEKLPFLPAFMGLRTRFFDEFFTSAAAAGVRQAVIVAAGLDARAYRLDWPVGATVYEVDQAKVLEFKDVVLSGHGARPKADRRPVAVDLREDWPAALEAAGFDPHRPVAWSAEGLLAYLPGAAHDALFERIDALSAPGSRLALNSFAGGADVRRFHALREKYFSDNDLGANLFGGVDVEELFYDDERADPRHWLTGHHWSVRSADTYELAAAYGLSIPELPEEFSEMLRRSTYLTAVK